MRVSPTRAKQTLGSGRNRFGLLPKMPKSTPDSPKLLRGLPNDKSARSAGISRFGGVFDLDSSRSARLRRLDHDCGRLHQHFPARSPGFVIFWIGVLLRGRLAVFLRRFGELFLRVFGFCTDCGKLPLFELDG